LDVARAHWATAQAGIRTAGQHPNPAVSATPQYVSNPAPGDPFWVAAFTFEPTIETAGKRGHRIEEAQQTAESARLSLAAQAWQVRSQLRTSLVDYATARQRVVLLRNVRDAQEQSLKLLEGRLAAGEIGATELATLRVALIRAQADLTDAQRQVADTRAALAQALGLPLRALEGREVQFDLENGNGGMMEHWNDGDRGAQRHPTFQDSSIPLFQSSVRRQALHSRADILAALADYAASQAALQLEIAKQYPDIRLGPGYEYDQGLHKWGLSVATDALPVFNRNQGPIAEAEAKRSEAAAKFLALQIQVINAIDRATAALAAAREQLRQTEALLTAQRQHVQAVEAMVKAGAADQFDLRSAQVEAATTEVARLDALVKVQQAFGQLEDAMQYPAEALPSVEKNPREERTE
jgi:outer membrane protein TolC